MLKFHRVIFYVVAVSFAAGAQELPHVVENVAVYQEAGRFGGWPANNGIWNWGDEIVVGFTLGYYKENPRGGHDIDYDRPSPMSQARSMDGGRTWSIEDPKIGEDEGEEAPSELGAAVDFSDPDLALRFRNDRWYVSEDRAKTWRGPYQLPHFGRPGLLARTDYIVEGKERVTAFVTAEKEEGREGQPLCIRTTDGGRTWDLVGWIGPQPPVEGYGYAIMPATVRIAGEGYFSMIRRGGQFDGKRRWWIEPFVSPDDGASWYLLDAPVIENAGNPATLTRLEDGRIAMTYGWRTAPYGIRARLSDDEGQTWSGEFILRQDGASWDIGYPRTVQREDGKCVTIYYYHDQHQPERYIAATIWDPAVSVED